MRYNIVVASYNCMQWLPQALDSIRDQTYTDYNVCVVDDNSDDKLQPDYIKQYCDMRGWAYILNDKHKGAMCNQVAAIAELAPESDDDVIIIVDGDDKLAHNQVFEHLNTYYAHGAHMTYGSYQNNPPNDKPLGLGEYLPDVVRNGSYRTCGGLWFNHLRTFKFGLFNQLDENVDFKLPNGEWFPTGCDAAIMVPCLELSRGNYVYIREILYDYNSANPSSDWRRSTMWVNLIHRYILEELPRKV